MSSLRIGTLIILLNLPNSTAALTVSILRTSRPKTQSQCFQCLSPSHDMNVCGPCLNSGPAALQCRVIRFYLWNLEPWSRCPCPVNNVDTGMHETVLYLGSIDQACHWLANWNLAYLDCSASCLPPYTRPSPQDSGYFIIFDSVGFITPGDWSIPRASRRLLLAPSSLWSRLYWVPMILLSSPDRSNHWLHQQSRCRLGVLTCLDGSQGLCCMIFLPMTPNCGQVLIWSSGGGSHDTRMWCDREVFLSPNKIFLSPLMTSLPQLIVSWPVSWGTILKSSSQTANPFPPTVGSVMQPPPPPHTHTHTPRLLLNTGLTGLGHQLLFRYLQAFTDLPRGPIWVDPVVLTTPPPPPPATPGICWRDRLEHSLCWQLDRLNWWFICGICSLVLQLPTLLHCQLDQISFN